MRASFCRVPTKKAPGSRGLRGFVACGGAFFGVRREERYFAGWTDRVRAGIVADGMFLARV
jgi:hypothetical protein